MRIDLRLTIIRDLNFNLRISCQHLHVGDSEIVLDDNINGQRRRRRQSKRSQSSNCRSDGSRARCLLSSLDSCCIQLANTYYVRIPSRPRPARSISNYWLSKRVPISPSLSRSLVLRLRGVKWKMAGFISKRHSRAPNQDFSLIRFVK